MIVLKHDFVNDWTGEMSPAVTNFLTDMLW